MRMGEAVLHFIDTSKSRLWALWIPCASIAVGLREALSKSQCPKSLTATCLCLGMTDCGTLRDRGYPGLVKIHHHLPSNFDSLWHRVIFAANQNWLIFGCDVDALMGHGNATMVATSQHRSSRSLAT